LGIDSKIKTIIWALEYIVLGCVLNKKQLKVKFQPTETSERGMAWVKQQPPAYRLALRKSASNVIGCKIEIPIFGLVIS
jgi:hypothetical protein